MTVHEILSRLQGVKGGHGQWTARCPAHDDRQNSLSVGEGEDGRVLLRCHAGCTVDDVTAALGLNAKDLFAESPGGALGWNDTIPAKKGSRAPVVATYSYCDDDGKLLAEKLRRANKSFSWRRPDGRHGWIYDRKGVPRRLYAPGGLAGAVFVCEGEKDVDTLYGLGYSAASGADGAGPGKWRKEYTEQLRGRSVCVFTDNDDVGRAYAAETCNALHGAASSVRLLDLSTVWPEIPEHGDVTDLVVAFGGERACEMIGQLVVSTPEWTPTAAPPQADSGGKLLEVISAPDLQKANLPPVKFLIEGILPDGTSLLTAASKIGKSWMVLHLGLCQAAGTPFMSHKVNQCGVLYLALEDSLHRLQNRMNKILKGKPAPEQFYFTTEAPKLDNGLLETLDAHLEQYPDTKLIIIDTLQKVRGQSLPREAAYAQDYREMETIKGHMDKRGVSVLFVHHNRKMKDDDDPFNMISGTNGIMGAADTIWTITKARRTDEEATLHITGRDVEQSDTVIRFDKNSWTWKPVGEAGWLAEQRAMLAYNDSPIVKTIKKLLEQSPERRWDGTAKDLMEAGKYIARTYLAVDNQKLGYAIRDLEKPLFEYDKIVHSTSKTNGNGGKKHHFYYQDLGQFEELEGAQEEIPWHTA